MRRADLTVGDEILISRKSDWTEWPHTVKRAIVLDLRLFFEPIRGRWRDETRDLSLENGETVATNIQLDTTNTRKSAVLCRVFRGVANGVEISDLELVQLSQIRSKWAEGNAEIERVQAETKERRARSDRETEVRHARTSETIQLGLDLGLRPVADRMYPGRVSFPWEEARRLMARYRAEE